MSWKEFKEAVEQGGVQDADEISYIDMTSDRIDIRRGEMDDAKWTTASSNLSSRTNGNIEMNIGERCAEKMLDQHLLHAFTTRAEVAAIINQEVDALRQEWELVSDGGDDAFAIIREAKTRKTISVNIPTPAAALVILAHNASLGTQQVDKKRLDWLEKNHSTWKLWVASGFKRVPKTIRAAIDAARQKEQPK